MVLFVYSIELLCFLESSFTFFNFFITEFVFALETQSYENLTKLLKIRVESLFDHSDTFGKLIIQLLKFFFYCLIIGIVNLHLFKMNRTQLKIPYIAIYKFKKPSNKDKFNLPITMR